MSEQEKESEEVIASSDLYKYGIGMALAITFILFCYAIYMLIYDLINY